MIAWATLNGNTISTMVGSDVHQLIFKVAVTIPVALMSIAEAMLIGAIGGISPAVRSLRGPVVADLRAV